MESPACDYEDWEDEEVHVLGGYEQEILDGNPKFHQ